jgi:hypothetical protein
MAVTGPRGLVPIALAACVWFALVFGPRAAEACSCLTPGPACQEVFRAQAVFAATVVSVEDTQLSVAADRAISSSVRRVRMRVTEAFTGVLTGEVIVTTGQGGGDCGYPFIAGGSYVVYGQEREGDTLVTTICSRTKPVRDAAEDLAYLRSFTKAPAREGRIIGEAVHWDYDYASGGPSSRRPVPDLRIVIEDDTRSIAARTDRDGHFDVRAPVGEYRVRAEAPAGMYFEVSWPVVTLADPRGCAAVKVGLHSDGHVAGRVVTSRGEPVPHLALQLGPPGRMDDGWSQSSLAGRTDSDGRFDIGKVPPGSYLLGFNTEQNSSNGLAAYPRAFLPGVTARMQAELIQLGPGQRVSTTDFVVPETIPFTTIVGTVLEQDGRLVAGANVYLKADSDAGRLIGGAVITGSDGRFSLAAVEGQTYRIVAERVEPGQRYRRVEVAAFVARAGAEPMTIRLSPPK